MKTKNLVLCGVCAAIICALAPLSVPLAGLVPVTLATFAVMLTGVLLGGKFAVLSVSVYLLIGAMGVPVFSGYSAGVGVLFGPTGGYLIGYIPLAFLTGALYEHFGKQKTGIKKYAVMITAMMIGTAVLYTFGTVWYCIVTGAGAVAALTVCVVPFLLGDLAKIAAVALLCPQLERAIGKIPESAKKNNKKEE
ncbi:MAG: biotin transporter BioY [Ruminococcus sp.]|nr:biotin transporter BioY [Ruminococcus sp.]